MPTLLKTVNCRAKRGFTLIELLIVIAIIAILVTVIIAAFGGTQDKARDARRREDLDALKKALELYKSDTTGSSYYPNCDAPTGTPVGCDLTANTVLSPDLAATYIRIWPLDPSAATNNNYRYFPTGCTGSDCTGYTILACLQNTLAALGDGVAVKPATGLGSTCPAAVTRIYTVVNP